MKDTVKKFQFGAGFGDIVNEELAIQQMRARNFLRNELVALDHATREQYYAIVNVDNPAQARIDAAYVEMEELRDELLMLRVPPAMLPELHARATELRKAKQATMELPKPARKAALEVHKKSVAALTKAIAASSAVSEAMVADKKAIFKLRIATLKKGIADDKPIAKAKRESNKATSGEALFKMNRDHNEAIKSLRNRAIAGYTHTHILKSGEVVSIVVPPLYYENADEMTDQHMTERSRAMKDRTELRFHTFIGEGRSFARVHSHRDLTEGKAERFEVLQAAINRLKEQRREAKSKEAKQSLLEQITAREMQRDISVPKTIGQSVEEIMAGDSTLFYIDAIELQRDAQNPTIWDKTIDRAERRRRMRTVAHVRIQSDEKGHPIWFTTPIVLHRPFPQGARVLSAAVNREKIGMKFRWNVEFTVKYQEQGVDTNKGIVAIDLGWAKDSIPGPDGRIRVAGVREGEKFYEFCLSSSFTEYAKKLENIHAIRDKHTNECFERIAEYRQSNEIADEALRTLLDKAKASLAARKGGVPPVWHLRTATWMLRKGDMNASDGLKDILEAWYERWNHLNEWLSNWRDNQLAAKKDKYRRFAYQLAQRNDTLLLDADNFAKLAKEKPAEHDEKPAKNEVRFLAAPATLRSALEAAFDESKGKRVLWASIASSKTCSVCWERNEELGAARTFVCPACGHTADREANACANIMGEFERKPGTFSADKKVAERLASKKAEEAKELVAAA
jgi:hypothetical protein